MMETKELNEIAGWLRAWERLRPELHELLGRVAASKRYVDWARGPAQRQPFVPDAQDKAQLARFGLLTAQGGLSVRINAHRDRLFLTDGVWVDPAKRVFPFCDESEALLSMADRLGWIRRASCVIDLAGGCGHSAWALDRLLQIMYDVNPRALAYAELNRELNGLDTQRYLAMVNDIRDGIPRMLVDSLEGEPLFLANMPFGPAPGTGMLPQTSDGGPVGMRLQRATFAALRELSSLVRGRANPRALIMGLSLGDASRERWMMREEAVLHFGQRRVTWLPCPDRLLRIDGSRVLANPAPVDTALPAMANCTLYHPDPYLRAAARDAWHRMATEQVAAGWPDIAYGVVAVELG